MDQTLSLPSHPSPTPGRSAQVSASVTLLQAASGEEEPESPGRSSRQDPLPPPGPDPVGEGLALVTGVLLALMAVLVPVAAVVSDSHRPEPSETVRAGW